MEETRSRVKERKNHHARRHIHNMCSVYKSSQCIPFSNLIIQSLFVLACVCVCQTRSVVNGAMTASTVRTPSREMSEFSTLERWWQLPPISYVGWKISLIFSSASARQIIFSPLYSQFALRLRTDYELTNISKLPSNLHSMEDDYWDEHWGVKKRWKRYIISNILEACIDFFLINYLN